MLGLRLFNVNRWRGPSDWWVIFDICVCRKCGYNGVHILAHINLCVYLVHIVILNNIRIFPLLKWSNLMARVSKATAHDYSNRVRRVHIMAARGFAYRIIVFFLCSGEFPAQRPVTRSFDVFFDLCLNKQLSKQWWGWWFETPSRPSRRHRNDRQCLWITGPNSTARELPSTQQNKVYFSHHRLHRKVVSTKASGVSGQVKSLVPIRFCLFFSDAVLNDLPAQDTLEFD